MSTPLLEAVDRPNGQMPVPSDVAAFMNVIERASANPEFDANKLEKLLTMYERIMDRNAQRAFNVAFADMQAKLPVITAHGKIEYNGKVISEYAEFEDINDAIKPILHEHGFGLMFKVKGADGSVAVTPILIHREGHREEGEPLELGADTSGGKNSVQAMGSSTSYGKRYAVIPFLNITTRGEDDDGQAGGAKLITEGEQATLKALMEEVKQDRAKFFTYASSKARRQIKSLAEIPASLYAELVKSLEKKRSA